MLLFALDSGTAAVDQNNARQYSPAVRPSPCPSRFRPRAAQALYGAAADDGDPDWSASAAVRPRPLVALMSYARWSRRRRRQRRYLTRPRAPRYARSATLDAGFSSATARTPRQRGRTLLVLSACRLCDGMRGISVVLRDRAMTRDGESRPEHIGRQSTYERRSRDRDDGRVVSCSSHRPGRWTRLERSAEVSMCADRDRPHLRIIVARPASSARGGRLAPSVIGDVRYFAFYVTADFDGEHREASGSRPHTSRSPNRLNTT